jgi:MFS family permease
MPADDSIAVSEKRTTKKRLLKQLFGFVEIIIIGLILLSIIGIGIVDYFPQYSRHYWFAMVMVFAVACLILEWSRARGKGQKWTIIVKTQLLLWVGLLLAVQIVFLLQRTRGLNNENTGLIILLLLALTTFFAGINLGWRLLIVGIFLGVALIGAVYLDQFAWMFLIIAIVVVAIFLLLKHYRGTKIGQKQNKSAH